MSRAHCVPCEEACEGLACACACHRAPAPGYVAPTLPPAAPRVLSLDEARAIAVSQLVAAAREVLAARGAARKLAEAKVHDTLAKLDVLGVR